MKINDLLAKEWFGTEVPGWKCKFVGLSEKWTKTRDRRNTFSGTSLSVFVPNHGFVASRYVELFITVFSDCLSNVSR